MGWLDGIIYTKGMSLNKLWEIEKDREAWRAVVHGVAKNRTWLSNWTEKITAGGDCSHEIKRCLLLGRKVITNLDSILKSRDITLPTKVHLIKALVFPIVMNGCESRTIKKAEHQRIDAFELWCWRRLLRVPWTARRSNQSILKEIRLEYSLEGLTLKLKLSNTLDTWLKELTHWKRPWCWERLRAGGEGGDRGWDGWMASLTQWRWVWVSSGSWWWTRKPGILQSMGLQRVEYDWANELNWTEVNVMQGCAMKKTYIYRHLIMFIDFILLNIITI